MSDALYKPKKDFSATIDEQLPQVEELAQQDYKAALEKLLILEKQTRQSSDLVSSKRVLTYIVDLLTSKDDWDTLNEQLILLSKKHGQLKLATQKMVQQIISKLDNLNDNIKKELDLKIKTIENIRIVTENKIYVEVERARVTKLLSEIKLVRFNDIEASCDLMCELQVETYGSMEIREKMEFILIQIDLSIKKGDFEQAKILARKILPKTLNLQKFHDIKLSYYQLMVKIGLHANDYANIVKYYLSIYEIDSIKSDKLKLSEILTNIAYFIILSPYNNYQNDLINRIYNDPNLKKLPLQYELIKSFITQELMRWPIIEKNFGDELNKNFIFNRNLSKDQSKSDLEAVDAHWSDLKKRVIEHNLRVIAKYYSNIRLNRLVQLLDLSEFETESFISDLVNNGIIYAKINRPAKVVSFVKPQDSNEILNNWSDSIEQLLNHVETIGHLITKEEMMSGIKS
ncbi:proteasome regulatory particle lid subunit RPN5 [Ascoidea rubescens DSM 1968]|uniref:YDL147Wp-like protein n=1 Tax=Ascoidea rubescens DSM 1968 TaxID=1344418 RepID=A0A1D2VCX5_9ASCO|nr:YDL147Wp-like protein [Ascoidea rubescens DSM 1968]ODV59485.1 YDL147Wp-like protein [Ascoidea rubescens DSM 1968]